MVTRPSANLRASNSAPPTPWTIAPSTFSRAKQVVRPVISDREYGYEKVNVADERRDSESLLNWTERIIRMRKECPEISWGGFEVLRTNVPEVLAIRPYGCRWMRVGAIGNTLERSDLDLTNPMR